MRCIESTFLAIALGCGRGSGHLSRAEQPDERPGDLVSTSGNPWVCDVDDDGWLGPPCLVVPGEGDCDDADPTAHPGATEELDGADDDCDGDVDEGTAAWDADGDCVCVAQACTGSVNADCGSVAGGDCDDADPQNFPGNGEVCDGADNDCDQVTDNGLPVLSWWSDVDQDGFGSQVASPTATCGDPPAGTVANNADCDDLHANVAPFLSEVECDGLENDCDPSTRDGVDQDADGVDHCFDCDDADSSRSPALAEVCDGRDNDCDGDEDDGLDFDEYWPDADGDGYGNDDADEIDLCADVPGWVENDDDCNDGNYWVNPSAYEWHCDWIDNDCDDGDECP